MSAWPTLFVANIDYSVDEDQLFALLSRWITPRAVKLARDDAGRSRGYAHVEVTDDADLDAVLELNNYLLGNRWIRVERARQHPHARLR